MNDDLKTIPKYVLRELDRGMIQLDEEPVEITYHDNGEVTINWNESGFNFFFSSDGSWSFEDRDTYRKGKTSSPCDSLWTTYFMNRGHMPEYAKNAVQSWIELKNK